MILVIGGTGKIGSLLIDLLLARETPVRVLVRDPERTEALQERGAEAILGDLKLPDTLTAALDGVERVFLVSPPDPEQVELHANMIDRAWAHGVQQVVRISVVGARVDSRVGLIRWHAVSEQQLLASEIPHVNLRCSSFMQNRLMSAATIQARGQIYGCQGEAKIALVDVRDIAAVAAAVLTAEPLEAPSTTLEVTGPQALSGQDEARILSEVLQREVGYVDLPPTQMRAGLIAVGLPAWLADDLVAIGEEQAGGMNSTVSRVVQEVAGKDPISYKDFVVDSRDAFTRSQ